MQKVSGLDFLQETSIEGLIPGMAYRLSVTAIGTEAKYDSDPQIVYFTTRACSRYCAGTLNRIGWFLC